MAERFCVGCGVHLGHFVYATEAWHEHCGRCNERFYAAENSEENKRAEAWQRLVMKYGEELAGEIWGDSGM